VDHEGKGSSEEERLWEAYESCHLGLRDDLRIVWDRMYRNEVRAKYGPLI
jgi:hypothetical protein